MNTVYCWFDRDDNTTTINSINIIKEPRKPWMENTTGERVLAKLPQFGLWNGVIVEISESKKDLVQKMAVRQKASVLAYDIQKVDKSSESELQKTNRHKVTADADTKDDASDGDSGSENDEDEDEGKKKQTKKVVSKKRTS